MRLKQVWNVVPIPSKAKLMWERITFSRITQIYLAFSVLHCIIQVIFQAQAFAINARATTFLWSLVTQADAKDPGFAVMTGDELRFCETVPKDFSTASCELVWSLVGASNAPQSSQGANPQSSSISSTSTTPLSSASTLSSLSFPTLQSVTLSSTSLASSPEATRTGGTKDEESDDEGFDDEGSDDGSSDDEDSDDEDSDDEDDVSSVLVSSKDAGKGIRSRGHPEEITVANIQVNGTAEVVLNGLGFEDETVRLSRRCLLTLNWPVEELNNTKREDITFIAFQFWVLGMSVVALLNESIPHIVASLLTHLLATGWASFQVVDTKAFQANFNRMTTASACDGINLLSDYWKARANAEIPSLALNAAALIVSSFLSWKLFKLFGWQTFKRVGASRTINRVYKLVLSLSIAIQLSLFFIVVSVALWIDSLCNGQIGRLSDNPMLYKGVMVVVCLLLVPWLATGWIAVRRELRIPMMVFLVLSFAYSCGWGAMFISPTFRWTFVLWRFFSVMTSASVVLTLLAFLLGVWCRINFGKGLPRYLNAEEPLPDEFVQVTSEKHLRSDEEKVEFPVGRRGALPTYSAAFGKDTLPRQMNFGTPRLGPRFTSPSLEPFETPTEGRSVQSSFSASSRSDAHSGRWNSSRTLSEAQHVRSNSVASHNSYSTYKSTISSSSSQQHPNPFSKKWEIE